MSDISETAQPTSTEEKIATAVAPPSAAQPSESNNSTGVLARDSNLPTPKFILTEKALDDAFNDIWANNANAISHCYSNTDALKVDFTRTGKRSFLGMINDATNSVYRMVQGAVTDFFRQTVLDFTYGSIGLHGLEKYYDDLNSRDPSESIRLARVRASAIESCRREVVPDSEPLIGGWTLCSPLQANIVSALKLEEKVALLTAKALYVCSYDFGAEKLNEFTKVLVGDIIGIQQGLYVTSPHESSHSEDNWGFLVTCLNSISRSNTTASIKNITTDAVAKNAEEAGKRIFAFRAISDEVEEQVATGGNATMRSRHLHHTVKANPAKVQRGKDASTGSNAQDDDQEEEDEEGCVSSKQKVRRIVELLRGCCIDAGAFYPDNEDEEEPFITDKSIQSLDEAKAMMPLFGPLIEGLKRRLWL
ncbi:hypothetical protein NDA16_001532 [Ustilago loliicola]|nr:hypothetical protein NDA16_001532 [Ustilago loliicola]